MPSLPSSPSRSRSLTSLLLLVAAAGCGGDDSTCGPGAASGSVLASADTVDIEFDNFSAGLNNDCPAADAPSGVVSLTIFGHQPEIDGSGFFGGGEITLCVSRPDQLASQSLALGGDNAGSPVRIIDLSASLGPTSQVPACSFALDTTRIPTGTASASGLCGNGSDSAGFALTIDGAVSLTRTCNSVVDTIGVTLKGTVPVAGT